MGWLGLDDTDHLGGGCTTHTLWRLLASLPSSVKVGELRLVRLWPLAPGRTRGNAAVAVELNPSDRDALLAFLDRYWAAHVEPLSGLVESSHHSDRVQHPADPGMVWFDQPPPPTLYWRAVRKHVDVDELPAADRSWGGWGRVGATAAIAWPAITVTYEAIAWRVEGQTGSRGVDGKAMDVVDSMDGTFLTRDPRRGSALLAPRGPSPVLFGVRAHDQGSAEHAARVLLDAEGTEPASGWRVFTTNQASGDHLDQDATAVVEAVEVHPTRKHATLETNDGPWLAYAESGDVNRLARWLRAGDRIEGRGLVDETGRRHLEALRLVTHVSRSQRRPVCDACNVRLKSMGRGQGLRCPRCKNRSSDRWEEQKTAPPFEGWVEPPHGARRHLARPLAWDGRGRGEEHQKV